MLISPAYAAAAPAGMEQVMSFMPLVVIFIMFYFMLIRPQMKRAKEQKNMLGALQKGDEVVVTGGLVGKVTKVGDNYISLEVADNVVIQVQKAAVQSLLPKGTIKSINS